VLLLLFYLLESIFDIDSFIELNYNN
jgi:hypothetical protein